jgi:hypothetical protein
LKHLQDAIRRKVLSKTKEDYKNFENPFFEKTSTDPVADSDEIPILAGMSNVPMPLSKFDCCSSLNSESIG